jgi:hypothetical protein
MKTRRCLLSFLSILLLLPAVARAQLWSGIIDSKRAIDWTQAGLPGSTLPDSNWPVCTTISAYSGTDATITNALSACNTAHPSGGVVVLGAGTFTLSSGINFPNNTVGHLALRGQGANATQLNYTSSACANGFASGFICAFSPDNSGPQQGASPRFVGVTSGYSKGSTQLVLSSRSTVVVGSILVLNQCDTGLVSNGLGTACTGTANDNRGYFHCQDGWTATNLGCAVPGEGGVNSWRTHASEMEATVVTAINQGGCGATCVTISKPIEQPDWASGTQAVIIQPLPYVGVENLSMDASGIGGTSDVGIFFANTLHAWVSGVRISNMPRLGVHLYTSFGGLVKDSYFFGKGLANYHDHNGMRLVGGANNLLQNNICHQVGGCFFVGDAVPEQADVFAYNFSPATGNGRTPAGAGAWDDHGAGSSFHLLEGNAMFGWNEDGDHGNHLSQTGFRNFAWGWSSCANNTCGGGTAQYGNGDQQSAVRLYFGARYDNYVANVLGTPGWNINYKTYGAFDNGSIYIFGAGQLGQPTDTLVAASTLLWDNWDTANGSTQCNNSEVPTSAPTYPNSIPTLACGGGALPASFYLSSKPSWFGTIPWPAIGPDVSSGNVGQCSGTLNESGKFNGVAATSASQCAGSGLNTAWGGHVNANPAMACYFTMGGLPDGTGPALSFNGSECYGTSSSPNPNPAPNPPRNVVATVN